MILDTIDRLPLYERLIPDAAKIAEAFLKGEPNTLSFEVREKNYATKEDSARRYEVHAHTIDLMIAREGQEVVHICPEKALSRAEALPGGADGWKMDGPVQGSALVLSAGQFLAIFPGEAHMVGGHPGTPSQISKWVVKVLLP